MKLKEILNSPQSKVCGLLAQYYKENPTTAEKEASEIDPTVAANIAHLLSTEITSQLQQNVSSHETKSENLVLILKVISRLSLFDIPIQQLIQKDIIHQLGKVLSFCLIQSMLLNSFRPTTMQENLWNNPISSLLHALDLIAYNDMVEKKSIVEVFLDNLLKLISGQEYSYLVKRRSVQILNTVANDKTAKSILFKSDSVSNCLLDFSKLVSSASDFLLQSNLIEFLYRGFCINQKIITESVMSALFSSVTSYKALVNDFKKISKSEPEKDIRFILTRFNNELKEKTVYSCKCSFVEFGTRKLNTEWVDFALDHCSITYEDEEEIDTFDIPFSEVCLMRVSQKNRLMLQLNTYREEFKEFYNHDNEDHFITIELVEDHDIQLVKTKISQLIQKELNRAASLRPRNANNTPKVSTCTTAIPAFRATTSFSQEIVHLETEELEIFVPKENPKPTAAADPVQDSDTENGQHIGSSLVESIQKKNQEVESEDTFLGPTVPREQIPSIMKADVSFLLDEIENMDEEPVKEVESSKKRGQKRKLTESEKPKKEKQKSTEKEKKKEEKKSNTRRSSRNSTKKNYKQDSDEEREELEIQQEVEEDKVEKPSKKSKTKKNTEPQLPSTGKKSSKTSTPPSAVTVSNSAPKKESSSTSRQKDKEQFGGSDGLVDFDALMKKPVTAAEAAAVLDISDDESVKSRATIATEALFPSHKKKYTIHESSDEEEEFVRPKQRQKQDRKSLDNRRDTAKEAKPSRNSDILPMLNYDSEQSSQDFEESSRLFMEQFNKLLLMGKSKKQKKIQEKHKRTEEKISSMIQNHIIEMEKSLDSIKEWFTPKKKSNEEVMSTVQKKIKSLYLKFQKDLQEQLAMAKKVDTDNRDLESQLKDKLLAHKTAEKIATSDLEKKIHKEVMDCESTIKQIKQKDTQSQFVAMMQNLLKTKQTLSQEDSSADEGTVITSDY